MVHDQYLLKVKSYKKSLICDQIQEFINIIENNKINFNQIELNYKIINDIEKILYNNNNIEKNLLWSYNIKNYTKQLINIKINKICIVCTRKAEYKNIQSENDYYCWIHAQ
jgi:hypothetical protein